MIVEAACWVIIIVGMYAGPYLIIGDDE